MKRKLGLTALAFAFGMLLGGCGVGRTAEEVDRDLRRSISYDAHQLVDDIGLLLMTDRPLHTSKWVID